MEGLDRPRHTPTAAALQRIFTLAYTAHCCLRVLVPPVEALPRSPFTGEPEVAAPPSPIPAPELTPALAPVVAAAARRQHRKKPATVVLDEETELCALQPTPTSSPVCSLFPPSQDPSAHSHSSPAHCRPDQEIRAALLDTSDIVTQRRNVAWPQVASVQLSEAFRLPRASPMQVVSMEEALRLPDFLSLFHSLCELPTRARREVTAAQATEGEPDSSLLHRHGPSSATFPHLLSCAGFASCRGG